jgi:hypothetical protein
VLDLIDFGRLSIGGLNEKGNNFVAPPNKNLKIFTNSMPNHNIPLVKASETEKSDVVNLDIDIKEMIGLVEIEPCKAQNKNHFDISFSSRDIIKNLPDVPLYIASRINDKPTNGILIDPVYEENVITKEFQILHEIYQDTYERTKAWIKTHKGFMCPMMGSITLPLQVITKPLDFLFSIILMMDQFCVKLN